MKGRSRVLLWRDIDGAAIEEVRVGVVAVDFEDFGNEPPARSSFDVNHDVEGIADVGLDGAVRQFNPALQNAARESCQPLLRGTGMNRGYLGRCACSLAPAPRPAALAVRIYRNGR